MISSSENRDCFNQKKELNPQAIEFIPKAHQVQQLTLNTQEQETHLHKFLEAYRVALSIICLFPQDMKKHFHAIESSFKCSIKHDIVLTKPIIEDMVKLNIEQAIKHKNYSQLSSKFCYHLDALLYEHPSATRTNLLAEEMSIVYMYKKFINLITELYFEEELATQDYINFCCVISDYFVTAKNRNQQPYPFLGQALVRLLFELLNSNNSIEHLQFVNERFEFSFNTLILSEESNKEHLYKLKTLVESRRTVEERESERYKLLTKIHDMIITIEFNHNILHSTAENGLLSDSTLDELSEKQEDKPVCSEEEWDDFLDQFGDPVCDPPELSNLDGNSKSHT